MRVPVDSLDSPHSGGDGVLKGVSFTAGDYNMRETRFSAPPASPFSSRLVLTGARSKRQPQWGSKEGVFRADLVF